MHHLVGAYLEWMLVEVKMYFEWMCLEDFLLYQTILSVYQILAGLVSQLCATLHDDSGTKPGERKDRKT